MRNRAGDDVTVVIETDGSLSVLTGQPSGDGLSSLANVAGSGTAR